MTFRIPHSAFVLSRSPQLLHDRPLVERLLFRPDHLVGLVPLPREENRVPPPGSRQLEGAGDGMAAVDLTVMRPGPHSDLYVVEDLLRALGARIVRRDDRDVREAHGHSAHRGALAAVAIADGAAHH